MPMQQTAQDYEHQVEIVRHWLPIVHAAGMASPEHTPQNTFMLAGAIMQDEIVQTRHLEKMRAWRPTGEQVFAPSHDFYLEVLGRMTNAERAALKNRIIARHTARKV